MSQEIRAHVTARSGRTLAFKAILQIGRQIGDTLPDGHQRIRSFVVIPGAVDPPPTDDEKDDMRKHVEDSHRIAGQEGMWFKPG
jgi:hypothetical protein